MGLNGHVSMKAVKELQPRMNGGSEDKFRKEKHSLARQHANGVPLQDMGSRIFRVLRMSPELYRMNGDTAAIKEQLGIRQYGALPAQKSKEWYGTRNDRQEELPNTREALAIRDALASERAQLRKCLKAEEADPDHRLNAAEDLADLCDTTYPRYNFG